MVFEIKDKVALITGGASGIGLQFAKELLRKGAKGVTLADIDTKSGDKAVKEIEEEFGQNKVIYIETDISDIDQFDNAFKKTIENYKNIDILFNNAGIFNDAQYEKEIAVNLIGPVNGMVLGFENYLQKYRQCEESVIVNTASICGLGAYGGLPVYGAVKAAIISITRSWGIPHHYQNSKVRCVSICPGYTNTCLVSNSTGGYLTERYKNIPNDFLDKKIQEPEYVAEETIKIIETGQNGTIWVIEGCEPAYEYVFPERRTMKEHAGK